MQLRVEWAVEEKCHPTLYGTDLCKKKFLHLQADADFVSHSFGNSRYESSVPTRVTFGGTSRENTAC